MIRISSVVITIGLMLLTLGCQSSANQERVAVSTRLQLGDAYLAERQYQNSTISFPKSVIGDAKSLRCKFRNGVNIAVIGKFYSSVRLLQNSDELEASKC